MNIKINRIIVIVFLLLAGAAIAAAQPAVSAPREREVKIFWQRTLIDPSGATSDEMTPVIRRVDAREPLRAALETLFAARLTPAEEAANFYSSTFGMKFEGVSLKNGTALVRFSQPPDETNYGSSGPGIFAEAIERTALQFPSVRRVRICAIGDTLIDSEVTDPFPRCPRTK